MDPIWLRFGRWPADSSNGRQGVSPWLANGRLSAVQVGLTLILLLLRERTNVIIS
jgi:hypothetical protein